MVSFPNLGLVERRACESLHCGACSKHIHDPSKACENCGSFAVVASSDLTGASRLERNADGQLVRTIVRVEVTEHLRVIPGGKA